MITVKVPSSEIYARRYDLTIVTDDDVGCFEVRTDMRIRQLLLEEWFERFDHAPSFYWHEDGFMAEAWDDNRNNVTLLQVNNFSRHPANRGLLLPERCGEREITALQRALVEWSRATFAIQTVDSKLAHLMKEAKELRDNPDDPFEFVDVLLLLLQAAALKGLSGDDLVALAWIKLDICKARKWKAPDAEGCYHHEEEA